MSQVNRDIREAKSIWQIQRGMRVMKYLWAKYDFKGGHNERQ